MGYVVHYVTPVHNDDVRAVVLALQEAGATNISADTQSIDATWPSKDLEQRFDEACEEARAND